MRFRLVTAGLVATVALTSWLTLAQTSCGQTPTNVPVRTFEGAGRMDILCVQAFGTTDAGTAVPMAAIPVTLDHCAPVAPTTDPTTLTYHTLAVVTQTRRGELAVVDLTLGRVIDTSLALPGINFLPVGQNPTDVVVTPDAQMVFVAAAETNKPAIYAIPSTQLLGDSQNLDEPTQASEQIALPNWPACGLPQAPGRMVIVPTGAVTTGNTGDAGSDAGDGGDGGDGGDAGDAGGVVTTQGFEIVVVMPGNGTDESALIGLIDTAAFNNIAPGSLAPCPIKSIIHLAENRSALPTSWTPGPAWPVGVPYVDGGIDLFTTAPPAPYFTDREHGGRWTTTTSDGGASVQPSTNYQLPLWACPALAHTQGTMTDAGAAPVKLAPGGQVHGGGVATDGRFVWVADKTMPFIHVVDTQAAGALTEIAPLLATSIVDPTRVVTTSELAVSPVTRDYKRYLYAVDALQGSMMVYDVTDPVNGPRLPLTRPNPELDPLQAPDRILLTSPVATITFAHHDFPIPSTGGPVAPTGLLCNPNPNAGDVSQATPADPGVFYRDNGSISVPLGPTRLRGIFAFATMTNGQVAVIDVDDWDAPCRRPTYLSPGNQTGSLSLPEPNASSSNDLDPYHAPDAGTSATVAADGGINQWVTDEAFWPVIQPNRIRSSQLEEDDLTGTGGLHAPAVTTTPILLVNAAPVSISSQPYAILMAALPEFINAKCAYPNPPSNVSCPVVPTPQITPPNIFMAHDVPDVHVDQTWNIVYEGTLPNFAGIAGTVSTDDGYQTMSLSSQTALFCGHGIEDHRLGLQRFAAMQVDDAALAKPGDTSTYIPIFFDQRVGDYVQITDDILGATDAGTSPPVAIPPSLPIDDPYWREDQSCWAGVTFNGMSLQTDDPGDNVALARQEVCVDKFGPFGADQNPQRDFPILEATETKLVLGRYVYLDPQNRPTNGRVIAPRDTTPQVDFQLAQCCFHNQAHFNVRTGAEWVALGGNNLYLHHVVADQTGACVQACDPQLVLLNSRTPELAVGSANSTTANGFAVPITRNSPFAMRNPALSFFLAAPLLPQGNGQTAFSVSIRDDTWQFPTRGQYNTQGVSLTGTTTAVLPQSSMFVAPLGAIAVVDGSAEGLFIIDLNTLTIAAGSPFF